MLLLSSQRKISHRIFNLVIEGCEDILPRLRFPIKQFLTNSFLSVCPHSSVSIGAASDHSNTTLFQTGMMPSKKLNDGSQSTVCLVQHHPIHHQRLSVILIFITKLVVLSILTKGCNRFVPSHGHNT